MKIKKICNTIIALLLLITAFAPTVVAANELTQTNQTSNETTGVNSEVLEEAKEVVVTDIEETADQVPTSQSMEEKGTSQTETIQTSLPDGSYVDGEHTFYIYNGELTSYGGPGGDIVIPEGVIGIGRWAFSNANLNSVSLPNTLQNIGEDAFAENQLTNIVIPEGVTSIDGGAFFNNQLTEVTIPEGVESIGDSAFSSNKLISVILPNTLQNIEERAFASNQLTNLIISEGIENIGDYAFSNNQLTKVTIPEGVESIGDSAFSQNKLISVNLPSTLTSIGEEAFSWNQLANVTIPEGVTNIEKSSFRINKLSSVNLPSTLTSIGEEAFYNNQLTKVTIPEGVESIGDSAFSSNKLINVNLPSTLKIIGTTTFFNNQLTKVVIPDGVTSIGMDAFSWNQLVDVILPSALEFIGAGAFSWNQLERIIIPEKVTSIGERGFSNNPNFKQVIFQGDYPESNLGNEWIGQYNPKAYLRNESLDMSSESVQSVTIIHPNTANWQVISDTDIKKESNVIITRVFWNQPTIEGVDSLDLSVGEAFDVLGGVSATDSNGTDLTQSIIITGEVDTSEVGSNLIMYTVRDQYGFETQVERTVTVNNSEKPVFEGTNNLTINIGETFDPLAGVKATDYEDGDLTSSIELVGTVDVNIVGEYTLVYSVTDSSGNTTIIERIITVKPNSKPVISGTDNFTLPVGTEFKPLEGVSASDAEDGDLTHAIEVSGVVNRYQLGDYLVTYTVMDSKGNTTSVERIVSVDYTVPTDWSNNWAGPYIRIAMEKGWITTSDTFRPEDNITRAEFVKIVNKAFGYTELAESEPFGDVKEPHWFYQEILIAVKAGYISTSSNYFRPNETITREEVAAIITNIKGNKDTDFDKIQQYSDYNEISSWARDSVEGVVEAGYMGRGSDKFRPKSPISRAEAVVTLGRVFE